MAEQESPYLWSTTALTNGSADPAINFAEGQLPSSVNNSTRALMAALARFVKDTDGSLTTTGSANAYLLTINGRQTPLATGHFLTFKASFANTAAATLAVTNADAVALGAKAIRGPGDVALVATQIVSGGVYQVRYDTAANGAAGAWLLLNPSAVAAVSSIAGNTGAFTVSRGITNSTNDIRLASYQLQVNRSASQSFSTGVKTKIQFDTEAFDSGGYYDNATNYRYTPLVAGKYLVTVGVSVTAASGAGFVLSMIYKNGAEYAETLNLGNSTSGCATITALVDMNGSTDYIEGWGRGAGVTPSFDGGTAPVFTWMSISYTGP